MKKRTYINLILAHTFRKSVVVTDRAAILIGPLVTAYFWLRGGPMPEGLDGLIAVGIVITAGAALLARLVLAPFVIWKRDQAKIGRLNEQLSRPERRLREAAQEHKIALRRELGERIAKMIAFVELLQVPALFRGVEAEFADQHRLNIIRAREIINELSYDTILRVCSLNIIELCAKVAAAINADQPAKPLLARLWEQRKLTFRLLHHDFPNDMLALAQIENLIEGHNESFRPEGKLPKKSEEINADYDQFRAILREHPDLIYELERKLEGGDSDGVETLN